MIQDEKAARGTLHTGRACKPLGFVLVFLCASLGACQLDGDARLFRADASGFLRPPWSGDWKVSSDVVRRSPNGITDASRNDTFAIAFSDGFFKYLPDSTGVNEVVILLEFTEEGRMEENEGITKILGPFRRKADATHSSAVGSYVYGPKVMQGDALRMRIQIIEVDSDERDDTTALLDFLGDTASALADPVTKAEISLVKEVAKTLTDLNQNDILLEYEVTFVPYDQNVWDRYSDAQGAGNGITIPLRAGTWGLIKQENDHWSRSFFTRTAAIEWAPRFFSFEQIQALTTCAGALVADIIVAPVALFSRTFLDVPDRASLRPIQLAESDSGIHYKDDGLQLMLIRDDQRIHVKGEDGLAPYTSKTWLTFQVIRGGDPTTWQFRRALAPLEATVAELLKQSTVADVLNAHKEAVVEAAMEFQNRIEAIEAGKDGEVRYYDPRRSYLFADELTGDTDIEVEHPRNRSYAVVLLSEHPPVTVTTSRVHPERTALDLPGPPSPGKYSLEFSAFDAGEAAVSRATLPLTIVPTLDANGVTVAPDLATSPWSADGTLVLSFSEGLGALLGLIDSVEITGPAGGDSPGQRVVFNKDEEFTVDLTNRTVTLSPRSGVTFAAGSTLRFHFLHGLPSRDVR